MAEGFEEFDEKFARGFAAAFAEVSVVLDERARRLLVGAGARQLGRGGISLIANSTGISIDTVGRGAAELEAGVVADGRVRAKGAGRPMVERSDPRVWPALEQLVDPDSRGDPMSALRWTTKSTANLAAQLTAGGHKVSAKTVARILKDHGFSLRGNVKTLEGKQHPDRDGQFRYINSQVATFGGSGEPVISVDTKKKELVGNYKAGGREYQPTGEPVAVDTYDFIGAGGKVAPYGVFDVAGNVGWVNVGTDADTGTFAVESIRRWWEADGASDLPGRHPAAHHRRWRWLQRVPAAVVEDRAGRLRRAVRPTDHRRPLPARSQQMEPDGAQVILGYHDELARASPAQP